MAGPLIAGAAALSAASRIVPAYAQAASHDAQRRAYRRKRADVKVESEYEQWRRLQMQRQEIGTQMATYASLGLELEGTAIENLAATIKEMTAERVMAKRRDLAEMRELEKAEKEEKRKAVSARTTGWLEGIGAALGTGSSMAGR
jgi:NADH dehydrogenase/NADH:ubiquinone oxidoreductase subunit G